MSLIEKDTKNITHNNSRTHNGVEIKPDGQRVRVVSQPDGTQALLIDKARPEDAGQYSVIATNEKGDTKCDAPLSVASK